MNSYTEANTFLYIVYTRRLMRLHEKTNAFALYLASDVYCTSYYGTGNVRFQIARNVRKCNFFCSDKMNFVLVG